jgi:hypothetical protein
MTTDWNGSPAEVGEERGPDADAAELEQQIAVTREQMAETVQAIGEKLSPTNIVAGAKDTVREATIGRVEDVADAATDMIGESVRTAQGAGSGLLDTIRANPIPAAMAAIGIAWLWRSRPTNGRGLEWNGRSRRAWDDRFDGRDRYGASGAWGTSGADSDRWRGSQTSADADRRSGEIATRAGESFSDSAARAGSAVSQFQQGAGRAVDEAARQAAITTRQAQGQFERLFDDSPLVVGAAALGVGALAATLLPNTEFEERLYGEPRDRLVGQVEEVAHDAIDRVDEQIQTQAASASTGASASSRTSSTGTTGTGTTGTGSTGTGSSTPSH